MGSWRSEGGGRIGPIVWVRRRNGSWWPGKIMGPEELSECSLTSPRTGTPVKLLGREDASVDWYNLEKSKRVKAFRCGEFDDCIEKAESAQGMPIKKREKYARREDAILHALELEKQLLGEQAKLGVTSDSVGTKLSGSGKKELASVHHGPSNNFKNLRIAKSISNFQQDTDVQVEMDGSPNPSPGIEDHWRLWEDRSETIPRMKELQDLGVRTTPSKRKYYSSDFDVSGRDSNFRPPLNSIPTMERMNNFNGGKPMGAIFGAKRSRSLYFPTGSNDPFDDKEHSSGQIRMSVRFEDSDNNPCRVLGKEDNSSSEIMEDVESDYSEPDSSQSESESELYSSKTEPDTEEDVTVFSETEHNAQHHEASGDHESTSSEEPDESAGDITQLYPDDPYLSSEAASKWPSKEKRNLQYFEKQSTHGANGEFLGRPSHAMYHGMKPSNLGQRAYGVDGAYLGGKYVGTPMVGLDNGGFPYPSRSLSKDQNNTTSNLIDWEDMTWENRPFLKGPWEDGRLYINPRFLGRQHFGGSTRSLLVDVDLKVQSSSGRDRVPFVSLLSKLDGRAIVGHPIQIEALKDGSSESLVISKDSEAVVPDGNPALPPAWRTARRTNFRVPRPHVSTVFGGDESGNFPFLTEQERTLPLGKQTPSSMAQNSGFVRNHKPRPLMDRKNLKKPSKKPPLSFNQKTRTLSSIGFQHNFGTKTVHDTRNSQMDGFIKAETSGPTTVACIPVKLVFSRLLEKINRPASRAVSKSVV